MKNIFISSPKRELGWLRVLLMVIPFLIGIYVLFFESTWLSAAIINNQKITVALGIMLGFYGLLVVMMMDHFRAEDRKKKDVGFFIGTLNSGYGIMLAGLGGNDILIFGAGITLMIGSLVFVSCFTLLFSVESIAKFIRRKVEARRKAHASQSI